MSPVAVLLSDVNFTVPQGLWSWMDGEWFLPETGFEADQAAQRLGLPKDLTLATQVELAWRLIQRAQERGQRPHPTYVLSHAAVTTDLPSLAWWKCPRDFIERSHQDVQSEFGWDERQAQKYRAWEHHLALTVLASWLVAQTQYEWAQS